MPKRRKKQEKPEEPKVLTVPCPLKGHRHELRLKPHPVRPDLVIAQCSGRDVYCGRATARTVVESDGPAWTYVVPNFDDEQQGG